MYLLWKFPHHCKVLLRFRPRFRGLPASPAGAGGKAQMQQEKEILALNAFDPKNAFAMSTNLCDAVERRLRSFGSASVLSYQQPLRMERAEGVWMYDADGHRYLDLYNNVPSVGHSHPRVVEAICKQVGLLNTHTRYLNDVVDQYAERLLATFPDAIERLVLTCTGSEGKDHAL